MSYQPKPTSDEWTPKFVADLVEKGRLTKGGNGWKLVADAHNAAIDTGQDRRTVGMIPEPDQEWTHEQLQGLLRISNEDRYVTDAGFEDALDEINAALAAEREKHLRAQESESWLHGKLSDAQDEIQQLREQRDEAIRLLEYKDKAQKPLVELLEQVLSETVDARDYPDGPCLNADTRTEIKVELAKVKEDKRG